MRHRLHRLDPGCNWTITILEHQQLTFIGGMTEPQRDALLAWANGGSSAIVENTVLAVNLLYDQRWYSGIQISNTDLVDNHVNAILAALRISASDLTAIRQDVGSTSLDQLSIVNLSAFHRYAVLARSLALSVPDLITLKNLTGLQPFLLLSGATGPKTDPMLKFVTAARQVTGSQFTVQQLAYLYGPIQGQVGNLAPLQATQDGIMAAILTGLQNIAAANAPVPDPTGAVLRKRLAVLLPSAQQVDAVMGLVGGTAVYWSALAALPSGLMLPTTMTTISFVLTATIVGRITDQDVVSITVTPPGAGASPVALSYTVQATDTLENIADELTAQINAAAGASAAQISASLSGAVISLTAPTGTTWSPSTSPNTATEFGDIRREPHLQWSSQHCERTDSHVSARRERRLHRRGAGPAESGASGDSPESGLSRRPPVCDQQSDRRHGFNAGRTL